MTRRDPRLRRRPTCVVTIGAVLALASCGGGDAPAPAPSHTSSPTSKPVSPTAAGITDLPSEPAAATRELRARMVEAWTPIVRELPLPVASAAFSVLPGERPDMLKGDLWAGFGQQPRERWNSVESEFALAAGKAGWSAGEGKGSAKTLRKGPFVIAGKCTDGMGCVWEMMTSDVGQKLDAELYAPPKDGVPELNAPATRTPRAATSSTPPLRDQSDTATAAPR